MSKEYYILRYERTEYAKRIRKDYESKRIKERRCNMRKWGIRRDGLCNTLSTVQKDNYLLEVDKEDEMLINEPFIVASRGRNPENPSDRTTGIPTEQRLEPNTKGLCNTLTTVQKDSKECDEMNNLKIRKLTPKECWRLMGFDDEDFHKAEAVNSNTQLYKQAGNSIVVNCIEGILINLFKKGYAEAEVGDSVNIEQPNSKTRRGRVGKQVAQTLTTSPQMGVVVDE